MKKRGLLVATVVIILVGLASLSFAWDVTVRNDSGHRCQVRLYTDHLFTCHYTSYQSIASGSSYTWSTGAYCPQALEGKIYVDGVMKSMKSMNIAVSVEVDNPCDATAACWSATWMICRKRGSGTANDYDYGFCK